MSQFTPHSPRTEKLQARKTLNQLDGFICAHVDQIAIAIVGVGLLLRLYAASGTFLNPDEALHVSVAEQNSLGDAYRASLALAHPPLMVLLLYVWEHLGGSELFLRLPSVLAGCVFCWFFFKWVRVTTGATSALAALMFAALLSPLVALSAEVRQYALLLMFMAAAGYLLEISFARTSLRSMALSFLCLWLAMLSHYSGVLFAVAFCIYALLRVLPPAVSRRMLVICIAGVLGTIALVAFLYRTQISNLKGSTLAEEAANSWLRRSYFHTGDGSLPAFVAGRSFAVFQFIFGQHVIGDIAGLLFIIGVVVLIKSGPQRPSLVPARPLALLLTLPFLINCALAIAGRFPYGGTRHSIFLGMFALAAIGLFVAQITREQNVLAIGASSIVIAVCYLFGFHHQPYMTRSDQSHARMNEAIAFIRQQIPPSDLIFVDYQASLMLGHYLCNVAPDAPSGAAGGRGVLCYTTRDTNPERVTTSGFDSFYCAGHHIVSLADMPRFWVFTPESFKDEWDHLLRAQQLKSGANVWVVQAGWGGSIAPDLARLRSDLIPEQFHSFGRNISVFRMSTSSSSSVNGTM
jgi:hypothetical protein